MDEIRNILKGIVIGVIVIGVIIVLITGGNIFFFWSIFHWLYGEIQVITGMDAQLAKGVAAIFTAIFVALPLGLIFLSFTPLPQENKGLYRAILFLLIAAFFFMAYFGGKDTYFNSKTGEVIKYYSIRPNGEYLFYSEPGYDPVTGDKLLPVTKEIISKSKGWYKEPPKPYQAPAKRTAPESIYVPPSPPPKAETKPIESYAAPPQADPDEEPTPVVKPPIYTRSTPEISTCSVRFQNIGDFGAVILNGYQGEILRLGVYETATIELTPGTYYWRGINGSKVNPFTVPNRDEYRISVRVSSQGSVAKRRVVIRNIYSRHR